MVLHEWLAFYSVLFLNIHRSGVLTALAWLVPHETAAVSAQVLCTPYNHAPCHYMQSLIHKGYVCLTVTCHLHFWQNDRDLLRATVFLNCVATSLTFPFPSNWLSLFLISIFVHFWLLSLWIAIALTSPFSSISSSSSSCSYQSFSIFSSSSSSSFVLRGPCAGDRMLES